MGLQVASSSLLLMQIGHLFFVGGGAASGWWCLGDGNSSRRGSGWLEVGCRDWGLDLSLLFTNAALCLCHPVLCLSVPPMPIQMTSPVSVCADLGSERLDKVPRSHRVQIGICRVLG